MRFTLPNNKRTASGFTLVEVLIIAPIVILAVGGFVALMVTMVGDILVTRDQSSLTYDSQSALNRIEQDVRLSTQFLVTSGTQVAPQGSDSGFTGTAAFSNASNTLILSELATDKNPSDATRWLVYLANQPNPCGSDQRYNRPLLTKVVYFINNNSLWRRTVVPDWNTNATPDANTVCSSPWQFNSCTPGYSVATRCQTNDEKIMDNISSLAVNYYSEPDGLTNVGAANATSARTIDAIIGSQKTVSGGNVITDSSSVRVTKLNDIDTTQTPPDVPIVSHSLVTPENVEFTWQSVTGATAYQLGYQINGGQWVTQTVDANTTKFNVTANRNDVVSFRVASFNAAGLSAYGTDSQTMPAWGTYSLQNGWVDFGSSFATHGFTKTKDGVVALKGLIKNGSTATDTLIGTLPEGYRPTNQLIFVGLTSGNAESRIAIFPDGSIVSSETNASWYSLSGVTFLANNTAQSWVTPTFQNGWTNVGLPWQTLRATKDNATRVHLQGDIKQGTFTTGTPIATLSATYLPSEYLLFSGKSDLATGGYNTFGVQPSGSAIVARGASSNYLNTNAMYYPSTFSGWTNLSLQNSWVYFNTPYSTPQYTKASDGIVTLKGLIKNGTVTSGTVIANLPVGYRPASTLIFTVNQAGAIGGIDVQSNGNVVVRLASASWTSLDQISFIAEQ